MATLAEIKSYIQTRGLFMPVGNVERAAAGRLCDYCGRQGAELQFAAPNGGRTITAYICGDFAGCEVREKEKKILMAGRAEGFKLYLATLKIPESQ